MSKHKLWLMAACLVALPASSAAAQKLLPYQDPAVPVERRIDDLLSRMSLAQKVAALSTDAGVESLSVKGSGNTEGLHGVAQGGPSNWGRRNPKPTTQFPQAVGLGETWDPELIRQVGSVEGHEARYLFQNPKHHQGGVVVWGPNADLARDIRWGRTEESFGEDPFLVGSMVVAEVRGLQGDNPKYWLAASLMKHFLANSNEPERSHSSSNFDQRQLQEYYSVPFRRGVMEGGSRAFMASYNAVNGVPMHVNPILRMAVEKWGQNGIITTDGGGLSLLVTGHRFYPDTAWAAAAAIKAGINQFLDNYRPSVEKALAGGMLTEADIDRVLRGRYRVLIRVGQLDPVESVPYRKLGAAADDPNPSSSPEHRALARLVTQKSIVLLKNDGLLPLDRTRLKSVAVIGPWADSVLMDWYSGTPPYKVSPLQGIRDKLGSGVNVSWSTGADTAAAVAAARSANVAIVIAGNHPECNDEWEKCPLLSEGKEAVDRRSIDLEQEALIKHIVGANPRTVVVLISSFPYAINWTQANVPAILHMAQSSQELGNALADALVGDVNPGGRLVHTWVRAIDDLPPRLDYDLRRGRTYMYFGGEPLYPFGYGLSYTTFAYSNLRVSAPAIGAAPLRILVDVRNTGKRAGDEVAQLYVKHLGATVYRPIKELRGFRRITLEPGEVRTVSFLLGARDLAYWDADMQTWRTEAEPIRVQVGASSADIRLETTVRSAAAAFAR